MKVVVRPLFSLFLVISLLGSPGAFSQAAKEATVPEGAKIRLALQTQVSSKVNEAGDEITAILYDPLRVEGDTVLARGTEFRGRIAQITPAGRFQKQASMTIVFDRMVTPSGEEAVSLQLTSIDDYARDEKMKAEGEGQVKGGRSGKETMENTRDAAGIGMAGAGLILLAGGGPAGAAAALGGALAGGVLMTKGKEIKLQPGTIFRATFNRSLTLPVQETASKPRAEPVSKPENEAKP